jgi:hypothetical protein
MKSLKQILTEDYEYGDVEVPDKYDDLDFEPPAEAQDNAQQVIDWKEEHGEDEVEGMTQTGWQRANQLADGVEVSPDVISRMAQFERHEDNAEVADEYEDTPWKDRGHVAWLGWGGDAGVEWAQEMQDKMDQIDNQQNESVKLTEDKLRQIVREELNESRMAGQIASEAREKLEREIEPKLSMMVRVAKKDPNKDGDWAEGILEDMKDLYQELADYETHSETTRR